MGIRKAYIMKNLTRRTFLASLMGIVASLPFLGLFINEKEEWHEESLDYTNKEATTWGMMSNDIVAKRWSEVLHKEAQQMCYFKAFIK